MCLPAGGRWVISVSGITHSAFDILAHVSASLVYLFLDYIVRRRSRA